MKIVLVTDAWSPQFSGVVTTLVELVRELQARGDEVLVIHPGQFRTYPCPGYPGIDLALFPGRGLSQLIDNARPDAIHIATEGPLGWAARRHCLRRGLPFTTAFHARFPEILRAVFGIPQRWVYALLRRFHAPSHGVLVPTQGMRDLLRQKGFGQLRRWTHGVDTRLFTMNARPTADVCGLQSLSVTSHDCGTWQNNDALPLVGLAHPVSLYVGRLSVEKNLEDFLALDIPGSKVVCGVGPLQTALRERYPQVHWIGVLPRPALARLYASADVFVFPSRHETFGLAMLEAMACGVPVAAYPVNGPLEVLGESTAGAMHDDLHEAWRAALRCSRHAARARAMSFQWRHAAELFVSQLALLPSASAKARRQKWVQTDIRLSKKSV